MKKTCQVCDRPLQGRQDKKFCSPDCRSAYHNRRNADANNFVRKVNKVLRENRRILKELNPEGKTRIHKKKLEAHNFRFQYFTNAYRTQKGHVYYFCYEEGYRALEDDYYILVQRQDYVV